MCIEKQNVTGCWFNSLQAWKVFYGPPWQAMLLYLGAERSKVFILSPWLKSTWQVNDKLNLQLSPYPSQLCIHKQKAQPTTSDGWSIPVGNADGQASWLDGIYVSKSSGWRNQSHRELKAQVSIEKFANKFFNKIKTGKKRKEKFSERVSLGSKALIFFSFLFFFSFFSF